MLAGTSDLNAFTVEKTKLTITLSKLISAWLVECNREERQRENVFTNSSVLNDESVTGFISTVSLTLQMKCFVPRGKEFLLCYLVSSIQDADMYCEFQNMRKNSH